MAKYILAKSNPTGLKNPAHHTKEDNKWGFNYSSAIVNAHWALGIGHWALGIGQH
jgi:hypothetical protein